MVPYLLSDRAGQDWEFLAGTYAAAKCASRTAWLIHNKIMGATCEREEAYLLREKIKTDDSYFDGERNDGKTGRRSENKAQVVAAFPLDDAGTRCM